MNRIVVTGGNGFIGRYLLKKLSSCNLDSTVLISNTRNIHGDDLQHITTFHNSSLKFYTADIRDKKSICEIFRTEKADTCIHLAAKVGLRDSIKNPSETMDINVNGTLNVLKACHRYNVNNFVFASTAAVYGDAKELPIREDHILEPLSPYGNSKKLAEQYVNSFKKLKKIKNAVILRIFNPYGHGNANDPDVVTKFALSLKRKLPPIIYGNGNQTRDFISVDDIVDSILLSIDAMENTDKAKEDKKKHFRFRINF